MSKAIRKQPKQKTFDDEIDDAVDMTADTVEAYRTKFYKKFSAVPHYFPMLYCIAFDMFHGFEMSKEDAMTAFSDALGIAISAYDENEENA